MDDLLSDVLDYSETELAKKFGYGFDLGCLDAISEFPNCIANPFQTDPVQRNYNKVQQEQLDFDPDRYQGDIDDEDVQQIISL